MRVEFGTRTLRSTQAVRVEVQPPRWGYFLSGLLRFLAARGVVELLVVGVWLWLA